MKHSLKTVLTVRKGSVRVKNKNFKSFHNKNLLSYKIEILKKVKGIGEIIVNTDSDEAIKIAKDYEKVLIIKEIRILQVQIVVIVSFGHISLRLPIVIIYYLLIVQIH